jgi:hypothetical protein
MGSLEDRFDLHDYPFDRQNLTIRFENLTTPSDRLIYAIDSFGLRLPLSIPPLPKKPYELPLWRSSKAFSMRQKLPAPHQRGKSPVFNAENQVELSGMSTDDYTTTPLFDFFESKPPAAILVSVGANDDPLLSAQAD